MTARFQVERESPNGLQKFVFHFTLTASLERSLRLTVELARFELFQRREESERFAVRLKHWKPVDLSGDCNLDLPPVLPLDVMHEAQTHVLQLVTFKDP